MVDFQYDYGLLQFQSLILTFSMPRIHLVQYFADLINKVYVAFLTSEEDAISSNDQTGIIETIIDQETQWLDNMQDNEFDKGLSGRVEEKLKVIGVRLIGDLSIWPQFCVFAQLYYPFILPIQVT